MSAYAKVKVKGVSHSVHKRTWEEANGPVPDGYIVHHVNHDKRDNRLENLVLMTHQEHSEHHNQKHPKTKLCTECGTEFTPHPTKRERALTCSPVCKAKRLSRVQEKLTPEQQFDIALAGPGVSTSALAREYGVARATIRKYRLGSDLT